MASNSNAKSRLGVVGVKRGMTRVFTEEGASVPVTVVTVEPNRITQVKSQESDGYDALQVTTGTRRPNRVSKPVAGHYAKASAELGRGLWEFRILDEERREIGDALGLILGVGSEMLFFYFQLTFKLLSAYF